MINNDEHKPPLTPVTRDPLPSTAEPESRFTAREKWFIVILTAFVSLFSPLTSNIYLPAIPAIARAFNKSTELINLTVTMYMVFQGVAPMLWGTVSDHVGRRPISAVCLLILSMSCVGLALVPTSDYWLLMILRCLQAAGSASTYAIGTGIVGDISTREERGGFYGVFMVGPAIGPVIGGTLSGHLGWRSIFWFLCISSSICLIIIILLQPETLSVLVDRGRDNAKLLYQPVIPIIGQRIIVNEERNTWGKVPKNPFSLFKNPTIVILLVINALICAVFYGIVAPISSLFVVVYPFLDETKIGLCFLGIGGGMFIGSVAMGRTLDWEYRTFRRKTEARLGSLVDVTKEPSFPLEAARLRLLPYLILLLAVTCAGYGWCIQHKANIAGPLILQCIIGYISVAVMNATSTLMVDLIPSQSSSVTACSNLVRCTFSAALVSVIELIIKAVGVGWTYVLLGGLALMSSPLIYLTIWVGPRIRARRRGPT